MSYIIKIKKSARADLLIVLSYYEEKDKKLSENFSNYFDYLLKQVFLTPFIYQIFYKNIRRIPLGQKFPYNIFYTIDKDIIYILAVVHEKRSPAVLEKRITKH